MPRRSLPPFARYVFVAVAAFTIHGVARGQIFTDDFDDFNAVQRFSPLFYSLEQAPLDGLVDFAYDYAALGVESAPHSVGGTTIGVAFNLNPNDNGAIDEGEGLGVSPLIASLPTDYTIAVDAIAFYPNLSGGGASEHIIVGVNADRTVAPYIFAPAGAGQFFTVPHDSGLANPGFVDDYYRIADGVITELYDGDGEDADPAPDASTIGVFPEGTDPLFNDPGFAGNQWMEITLTKGGNILNLYLNGYLIDTYDASAGATSGHIVIGGADIFNSANPFNWVIFDNLVVTAGVNPPPPPAGDDADFNGDEVVDGQDFLIWQRGLGLNGGAATPADGDANGDLFVDGLDLAVWNEQYGTGVAAAVAIPEPTTLALATLALAGRPRRRRGAWGQTTTRRLRC